MERTGKTMNTQKLESILRDIDTLNERLERLEICNVGNGQFMYEYKFLHESIEALIKIRDDEAYYDYDIQGYIDIAGRLEDEVYYKEYIRRKGYGC